MRSTGQEVATYTGSVPGLSCQRALPGLPGAAEGLRTRLVEVVGDFCTAIRAQARQEGLGDILVALRLGPLAPEEAGLIVAVAAADWRPATAAVGQAVTHLRSIGLLE